MAGAIPVLGGLWSLVSSYVFIQFFTAGNALGSLHPTKPISSTVFTAGRPAQLRWLEDGHRPMLGDLGRMKIHLLAGNSTYLSTIAENVSPLLLSITVYIPQIIPANYHIYSLRFVPSHSPRRPIYTAPFIIQPNPFSSLLESVRPSKVAAPSLSSPAAMALSSSLSEIVRKPDATTVATTPRTTGSQAITPSASGRYLPSQQDSGSSFGSFKFGRGWSGRTGARRRTWSLDMGKMKFRLVFLVWPALIGLSLSM